MDNIFNKIFYFTQNLENGIVLFDRIEEFEIFQMRMGLENLCQNTLVYPVGRHSNGQLHYEIHTSPHSKNFYNSKCLKFCKDPGNSSLCNQMMHQIATYFCESRTIESLKVPDIGVYTYDEKYPQKKYICYQCPFSVFDKGIITRHLKNGANLHQTAAIGENSKRRFFARYGRSPLGAALFWLSRRPPADPGHSSRKV